MNLKSLATRTAPLLTTLLVVALAAWSAFLLWRHYQIDPWTPDGRVRADIVQVAADVSGIVTRLPVANDQKVHKGQLLFQIDRERFTLALRDAEAALATQRVRIDEYQREAQRDEALGELVSQEAREQAQTRVAEARAALNQLEVNRDLARLNLQRTRVLAPIDGTLSDLSLRTGNYVSAGKPVLALIDPASLHVEGYFEETRLGHVRVGQAAHVTLMGDPQVLKGHVQSIAAGIEDRDRVLGSNLLPNVNPTFSWVRLAQRVPVRIALDGPSGPALIAGRSATVRILPASAGEGQP